MRAAIFPGQGVHGPGMANGLTASRPEVFDEASRTLGVDVAELCRDGRSGDADLASTRWAQPAIVACSVASGLQLLDAGAPIDAAAGHSLGEYSALVVSGSLSVADGVHLVKLRAEAMDRAAGSAPGGMAAILGLHRDVVDRLCADNGTVVSGDNAPGQLTISGPEEALEATIAAAKGVKGKAMRINVAGAFHSPAMLAAVDDLRRAVDEARVESPAIGVWSPTTGGPLTEPDAIRDMLVDQLTKPVLWRRTVERLVQAGIEEFVDVGPGQVVANLVRRIAPEVTVTTGVVDANRV